MDGTNTVSLWVDGAFAIHNDTKSHTGAYMSLRIGAAYASSSKQKINMRSSTEAELVAADDSMPHIVWTRYFLEEQGYGMSNNIFYQEKHSTMLLEKNGRASSSKQTHHINIIYIFVTNRISAGEINVRYCPTLYMIGDYFTKPLQGSLFCNFRNNIIGITETDIPIYIRLSNLAWTARKTLKSK